MNFNARRPGRLFENKVSGAVEKICTISNIEKYKDEAKQNKKLSLLFSIDSGSLIHYPISIEQIDKWVLGLVDSNGINQLIGLCRHL